MPVTDPQRRALAWLACEIRREMRADEWDEPGVFACLEAQQSVSLAEVARAVSRLAEDPKAKTPGGLRDTKNSCWRERTPNVGVALPPKREEACFDCGRFVTDCVCAADPDNPRPPTTRAPGQNPRNSQHAQAARELLRAKGAAG